MGTNQLQEFFVRVRPVFHTALLLLTTIYVLLIPFGFVAKDNRWQTEEIVLLGILLIISSQLLESITDLTIGKEGISAKFKQLEEKQEKQKDQLSRQQAEIRSLQVALQGIVTRFELDKLMGLSKEESFLCYYSEDLYDELKRLRAMKLVQNHEGVGLETIRREYKDKSQKFDLKRFFYITDQGQEYLKLRGEMMQGSTDLQ